jgi:serine/threonine-protein kinase
VSESLEGEQIGPYVVGQKLGQGGMGAVYRATDYSLRRDVALKVLLPEFSEDVGLKRRFMREMQLSLEMEHPNLVPVYDVGFEAGRLYIAMRLVRGPNLAEVLDEGALSVVRATRLVSDIAKALSFMHGRGIVHRDVKPQNIFLAEPSSELEYAVLGDLGIARAVDSATHLTRGGIIGTPPYMAPELFDGFPASAASDVYSLSCVGYELLTGHPAFSASFDPEERARPPVIVQVRGDDMAEDARAAHDLETVFRQGVAVEPGSRFQTAAEFARAFARAAEVTLAGQPSHPHPRLDDAIAEVFERLGNEWATPFEVAESINTCGLYRREAATAEVASRLRSNPAQFQRDGMMYRLWPRRPA